MRIALWGATGSGKTTYLAALKLAADWDPKRAWLVGSPDDPSADDALNEWANDLVDNRRFPIATDDPTRDLSWRFVQTGWRSNGWTDFASRRKRDYADFLFTSCDVPGVIYHQRPNKQKISPEVVEEYLASLSHCDGLVFMFDPVRELEVTGGRAGAGRNGDVPPNQNDGAATFDEGGYTYFEKVLDRLTEVAMGEGGTMFDRALPQFVAVCTTKLDDPEVFEYARSGGWVTTDPNDEFGRPIVEAAIPSTKGLQPASGDSRDLFEALADNRIFKRITGAFHRSRIAYFTTSSLGYYVDEGTKTFAPFDYHNVTVGGGIRGEARPINVLEPLLWLQDSIRSRPKADERPPAEEEAVESDAASS